MTRWLIGAAFATLFLTYPLLIQVLDARGGGPIIPFLVAAVLLWRALRSCGGMRWLLTGLGLSLAGGVLILGPSVSRWVPAVAFLFVAWGFGRTLIHPPPLVERMVRLQYSEIPPELIAYLRRLTWLWCVSFVVLAVISISLTLTGAQQSWFWFHGIGIYLVMAVLVAGEFLYRCRRFQDLGEMPPPHETLLAVARQGKRLWED